MKLRGPYLTRNVYLRDLSVRATNRVRGMRKSGGITPSRSCRRLCWESASPRRRPS